MLNNILKKALPAAAALGTLACSTGAMAGPAIGFLDPKNGGSVVYTDLWTNNTDTALATGFIANKNVPPNAPYETGLVGQMRLSTMNYQGDPVLNDFGIGTVGREITQVIKLTELVTNQTSGQFAKADFGLPAQQTIDIDPTTAGKQQFAWYYDTYNNGDQSKANPNTATGYNGSGGGVLMASGHITKNISSFAAAGTVGTGSFDLTFVFDYVNDTLLDIKTNNIYGFRITGTTNIPPAFNPANMWDGTATASGLKLKVDSSFEFLAVPEPGSLALVGLAMGGLGVTTFGRRRNKKA
ncbi:PEP-CTERM sorting domain-containing protein [Azohydromonas aeria]|uniref:PEP-CTERM sorting domain-containing protein n=1 Tax=Azohydromonas aeria TaxID=2590212 RepID=UPI0012F9C503|nr:PEP-CTERM sorting domain-containing protein [Azohydromonas aeria]